MYLTSNSIKTLFIFDPRGRPTITAGSDHHTCLYLRTCTFQNLAKQTHLRVKIVIATGGAVGLAEWIIEGTHVLAFKPWNWNNGWLCYQSLNNVIFQAYKLTPFYLIIPLSKCPWLGRFWNHLSAEKVGWKKLS